MEFKSFGKIPRLSRECVITEKIDGTNASILIDRIMPDTPATYVNFWSDIETGEKWGMWAGSRSRWIMPGDDNFGFAAWVRENGPELRALGEGHHYGEWWGKGIQRNYGLERRHFSLFNVARWLDAVHRPAICDVVPSLYDGPFDTNMIEAALEHMRNHGSYAAPGFKRPEGIVVYHKAANFLFKKTIEDDAEPKSLPKERKVRQPKGDPALGGRRKAQDPAYAGPWRRKNETAPHPV